MYISVNVGSQQKIGQTMTKLKQRYGTVHPWVVPTQSRPPLSMARTQGLGETRPLNVNLTLSIFSLESPAWQIQKCVWEIYIF